MDIFGLMLFSLYLLSTFLLLYFVVKFDKQRKQLYGICLQFEMDKHLVSQELEKVSKELSAKELAETDGFVKFISQSRDWAFEYIEEVQSALNEFDKEIAPIIKWNKTYGTSLDGGPYAEKIKEISLAYNKLKNLLPKDNQTPNN
jgi:hypothetical protein